MKNKDLARDYLTRSEHRLAALEVLFQRKSYADVVREAQEIIELALKGVLRLTGIEPPRSHDVSDILLENAHRLPKGLILHAPALAKISKKLRRDRELAFYGSEDLTPSDFYKEEDAQEAVEDARWVVSTCRPLAQ